MGWFKPKNHLTLLSLLSFHLQACYGLLPARPGCMAWLAESLCILVSDLIYSGRGEFMPLPLKSKILATPGSLATDDIKMFLLWIQTLNLQASLIVHYELSKICNFCCYLSPKWTNLVWPFFEEKKRFYHLWGGKNFFSTEEKCYLMGWGEYGVKSKDIVARVGPSQRAENM